MCRLCDAAKSKYLEDVPVQGVFHHAEGGYTWFTRQKEMQKELA
jgi:hypothetical protein